VRRGGPEFAWFLAEVCGVKAQLDELGRKVDAWNG
jgi:hypothetical protein